MVQQDWVQAIELLTKLMLVQDGTVQPFTHLMLVRALRSNLEPAAALQAAVTGLIQYPDHAELLAEQMALFELAGVPARGRDGRLRKPPPRPAQAASPPQESQVRHKPLGFFTYQAIRQCHVLYQLIYLCRKNGNLLPACRWQGAAWQALAKRKKVAFKYSLKQENLPTLTSYPRKPLGITVFFNVGTGVAYRRHEEIL